MTPTVLPIKKVPNFAKVFIGFLFQSLQSLLGVRGQHGVPPVPAPPRPPAGPNPGLPLSGLPSLRPSNTLGHHRHNPHSSPLHPAHSPIHGRPQGVASPPFGLPPLSGPSPMQVRRIGQWKYLPFFVIGGCQPNLTTLLAVERQAILH